MRWRRSTWTSAFVFVVLYDLEALDLFLLTTRSPNAVHVGVLCRFLLHKRFAMCAVTSFDGRPEWSTCARLDSQCTLIIIHVTGRDGQRRYTFNGDDSMKIIAPQKVFVPYLQPFTNTCNSPYKRLCHTLSISLILLVFFWTPELSSSSSTSLSVATLLSGTTLCLLVPSANSALRAMSALALRILWRTGRWLELPLESLVWLESEPDSESELSLPLKIWVA